MANTNDNPTIPQSIIKRSYLNSDGSSCENKQKDSNRCPNVSALLDDYIQAFNSNVKLNKGQKLVPFNDSFDNKLRNKLARNFIKEEMQKHLPPNWFDGNLTFNHTYQLHQVQFDKCIQEISKLSEMAVYVQTSGNWAIKKFMEDIITNRRKTINKSNSRIPRSKIQIATKPILQEHSNSSSQSTPNQSIPFRTESVSKSPCNNKLNNINKSSPVVKKLILEENKETQTSSSDDNPMIINQFSRDFKRFKQRCYDARTQDLDLQQKKLLVEHFNNDAMWKSVEEILNTNRTNDIPKTHVKAVRESLIAHIMKSTDIPTNDLKLQGSQFGPQYDDLWLKFMELERSIFSLCTVDTSDSRDNLAASKSKKRNFQNQSVEIFNNAPLEAPSVRKSRRTALPSHKVKEQNNINNR